MWHNSHAMMKAEGYLRKSFFCNGKQMRCSIGPLFSSIHLDHARDVERINTGEGIRRNKNDTRVCVNLFLRIAQLDRLQHWSILLAKKKFLNPRSS